MADIYRQIHYFNIKSEILSFILKKYKITSHLVDGEIINISSQSDNWSTLGKSPPDILSSLLFQFVEMIEVNDDEFNEDVRKNLLNIILEEIEFYEKEIVKDITEIGYYLEDMAGNRSLSNSYYDEFKKFYPGEDISEYSRYHLNVFEDYSFSSINGLPVTDYRFNIVFNDEVLKPIKLVEEDNFIKKVTELSDKKSLIEFFNKNKKYYSNLFNEDLVNNHKAVYAITKVCFSSFEKIHDNLRNDREIALSIMSFNGSNLKYVNNTIKNDYEVVLAAVKSNGKSLEYSSKELRNNIDIVSTAVSQNGIALKFAEPLLKKNLRIAKMAVENNGLSFEHVDKSFKSDQTLVLAAVKHNYHALAYADKSLISNIDFIKKCIDIYYESLAYASDELKKNKELVEYAIKQNGKALKYASEGLRNNKEIVLKAITNHPMAIQYIGDKLKTDQDLFIKALKIEPKIKLFIPDELLEKKAVMNLVVDYSFPKVVDDQMFTQAFLEFVIKRIDKISEGVRLNEGIQTDDSDNPYFNYYDLDLLANNKDSSNNLILILSNLEKFSNYKELDYTLVTQELIKKSKDSIIELLLKKKQTLNLKVDLSKFVIEKINNGDIKILKTITKNKVVTPTELFDYASKGNQSKKPEVNSIILDYTKNLKVDPEAYEFKRKQELINRINAAKEGLYSYKEYLEELDKEIKYFKDDIDVVKAIVLKYPEYIEEVGENLKDNKDVVLAAVSKKGSALSYASEELQNNKEVVLAAVSKDGSALQYASKELQNNKQFVLASVSNDKYALSYASKELQNNKEVVLAAVSKDSSALQYASKELQNNKEIVLAAVSKDSYALKYASEELKNNKQIVLAAVSKYGTALEYASKNLQNNKEIALAATNSNWRSIKYLNDKLQNDKDVVNSLINNKSFELRDNSENFITQNKQIVLAAVSKNGYALKYASKELQNNKEIVLAAVTNYGPALQYASKELKNYKQIVLAAVTKYGDALEHASEELKDNKQIVLAAVTNYGSALQLASEELKNDKEVIDAALSSNRDAKQYVGNSFKGNKDVTVDTFSLIVQIKFIMADGPKTYKYHSNGVVRLGDKVKVTGKVDKIGEVVDVKPGYENTPFVMQTVSEIVESTNKKLIGKCDLKTQLKKDKSIILYLVTQDLIDAKEGELILEKQIKDKIPLIEALKVITINNQLTIKAVEQKLTGIKGYQTLKKDPLFIKELQAINPALKTTTVKQPKLESSTKKGGNKMKSDKQVLIFAATGKFEVFTRETLKAYIERKGHQLLDKISNKANYLINNDVNSTSSKNQFAKKNNIPIITEEELVKMLKK